LRLFEIRKKENDILNEYILAIPYCCGSSFVIDYAKWIADTSNTVEKIKYIEIDDHVLRKDSFEYTTNLPVIKVLRNPIKRFWSWHNRFVLLERERNRGYPNITKENSYCKNILDNNNKDEWFDAFTEDLYMNDTTNHTAPQSWAHNRIQTTDHTTYISTHNLNRFLGVKDRIFRRLNRGRPIFYPHNYYVPDTNAHIEKLYYKDFNLIKDQKLKKEITLDYWYNNHTGDNYV
jgi:hypothetical protein